MFLKCDRLADGTDVIVDIKIGATSLGVGTDGATTGRLATELGLLTHLSILRITGNALTGTIPTELARATGMTDFDLSGNRLIGTIPTSFATAWTNLQAFDVSRNQLEVRCAHIEQPTN